MPDASSGCGNTALVAVVLRWCRRSCLPQRQQRRPRPYVKRQPLRSCLGKTRLSRSRAKLRELQSCLRLSLGMRWTPPIRRLRRPPFDRVPCRSKRRATTTDRSQTVLRNTSALPITPDAAASFNHAQLPAWRGASRQTIGSSRPRSGSDSGGAAHVEITPAGAVERQSMTGRGIRAELVRSIGCNRIELRYRGTSHLILDYEQGVRRGGETFVDGVSPSTLRDFTRKLTFLPAGHDYFEWHQLHTSARLLYVYFDPAELAAQSALTSSSNPLNARLFFEDESLWSTVEKLKGLIVSTGRESLPYFEALGVVLMHELLRLSGDAGPGPGEAPLRGGLAAWQRRLIASYIEEHLPERLSLATLARLVHLSPYHFSRAFKQSFGVPPHRYHTYRRIERAKVMLERHAVSVTEVGLSLGFNETSSFTTTFRKMTGLTPSRYHRGIAHLPAQN